MKKISYIIVTYNSESTISRCIESVLSQKLCSVEVIIVDNCSNDSTVMKVQKFSKAKLIISNKNGGYGAGNNMGARFAKGEILCFLNPDTELPSNHAQAVTDCFKSRPGVAVVGTRILNKDGTLQRTCNRMPTLRSLWFESSAYCDIFPNSQSYKAYIYSDWDRLSDRDVDAVSGACLAVRKDCFDRIGGFDEGYFLFFEEFYLAREMKKIQLKTHFMARPSVIHIGAVSTSGTKPDIINRSYEESKRRYLIQRHGHIYLWIYLIGCKFWGIAGRVKNIIN